MLAPSQFGLVFFRDDDQLFLSTAGAGQFFSNCDVCDLAERLERVLVAMTADPTRRCHRWICSMRVSMPAWMRSVTARC